MPVTFPAHQALVLPLKWRWRGLDGVALCIGSAAPDLGYAFQGTRLEFLEAHYRWWVLLWGVVITLLVSHWLRWLFARAQWWAPMVWVHTMHESSLRSWSLANIVNRVACALIGVVSHVGWDSMTHGSSPWVKYVPWLRQQTQIGPIQMYRFAWMQWLGHTAGSVLALWMLWRIVQSKIGPECGQSASGSAKWRQAILCVAGGVGVAALSRYFAPFEMATAIIRGWWFVLIAMTVVVAVRMWKAQRSV
jgi:hypothetical protein